MSRGITKPRKKNEVIIEYWKISQYINFFVSRLDNFMFYVKTLHFKLILSSRHVTMTIYCFRIDSLIYSALHPNNKTGFFINLPRASRCWIRLGIFFCLMRVFYRRNAFQNKNKTLQEEFQAYSGHIVHTLQPAFHVQRFYIYQMRT